MISGGDSSLLQIKEDNKFCTRLLSKEASLANSSFRVYYGVAAAGSVPFGWESRPGTPKHTSAAAAAALPPLTPPPSYYFSSPRSRTRPAKKTAGSKYSCLSLPRLLALKKATVGCGGGAAPSMSPSSSLSQSSSSSLSSSSSYSALSDHRRRPSDDDEAEFSSGGSLPSIDPLLRDANFPREEERAGAIHRLIKSSYISSASRQVINLMAQSMS